MWKWIPIGLLILAGTTPSFGQDRDRRDTHGGGEPQEHRVLKVFDAKGRLVGPLSQVGSAEGVVLNVGGVSTFAAITRPFDDNTGQLHASKYAWTGIGLSYTTADCSGPPIILDAPPAFRPSAVDRNGASATLYIAPDAPTTLMTVQSSGYEGFCEPLTDGHSGPPPFTGNAWSIQTVYSLTDHYPEPLAVHY